MTSDKIRKTAKFFNVTIACLFGEQAENESSGKPLRALLTEQQKQIEELKQQVNKQNEIITTIANSMQKT